MRWFTVLYPKEDGVKAALDAIILLANPKEKEGSHITLRGPYSDKKKAEADRIAPDLIGRAVSVFGADCFLGARQNTVFLNCDSDEIKRYWDKSDYGYRPHLTLYDGASPEFAGKLLQILKSARLFFRIFVGGCEAVGSAAGQKSLNLWLDADKEFLRSVTGEDWNLESIRSLDEWERLMFIERICPRLNWLGSIENKESDVTGDPREHKRVARGPR